MSTLRQFQRNTYRGGNGYSLQANGWSGSCYRFMDNNVTFLTCVFLVKYLHYIRNNVVREKWPSLIDNYINIKKENISYDAFYNFWRWEIFLKSWKLKQYKYVGSIGPFSILLPLKYQSTSFQVVNEVKKFRKKEKLTKMNRPSSSPAVLIFKWSGNNLEKNYTTYSYSFIIKTNYLNNSG